VAQKAFAQKLDAPLADYKTSGLNWNTVWGMLGIGVTLNR
jgi:hypothetical protein